MRKIKNSNFFYLKFDKKNKNKNFYIKLIYEEKKKVKMK